MTEPGQMRSGAPFGGRGDHAGRYARELGGYGAGERGYDGGLRVYDARFRGDDAGFRGHGAGPRSRPAGDRQMRGYDAGFGGGRDGRYDAGFRGGRAGRYDAGFRGRPASRGHGEGDGHRRGAPDLPGLPPRVPFGATVPMYAPWAMDATFGWAGLASNPQYGMPGILPPYEPPPRRPRESGTYGRGGDRAVREWAARNGYDVEFTIRPRGRTRP
jgi:hypothetical protein